MGTFAICIHLIIDLLVCEYCPKSEEKKQYGELGRLNNPVFIKCRCVQTFVEINVCLFITKTICN